jgi:hypothetical protein
MCMLFRATDSLYHSFVTGNDDPVPVYLICGQDAQGYCLGEYSLIVLTPSREILVLPALEPLSFTALYDFDHLTFFSRRDPSQVIATSEHCPVKKGETVQLDLFNFKINRRFSYEQDLERVLSV